MLANRMWDISKYARYVEGESKELNGASKGEWKSYEGMEKSIKLAVLPDHLMLSGSSNVLESFSLIEAHTHVRGVRKGDSLLIVYKMGEGSRRFRVRFQSSPGNSGLRGCSECHTVLMAYFPFKNLDENSESSTQPILSQSFSSQVDRLVDTEFNSSQIIQIKQQPNFPPAAIPPSLPTSSTATHIEGSHPISDLAEALMNPDAPLPGCFSGTNYPTEHIRFFIQVCLTDPSFPGFVKAVEQEMEQLFGQKVDPETNPTK
ncbi:Meiotic recombination protein [Oopsacas minuta]|uniref:Meiotic recombination protein n=1 Tax=Oopsacas minuta TaxID=111878 RepID=A0AAV7JV10_9METZ|nr:Meiotic recombination protein [Oopsacas minuta]